MKLWAHQQQIPQQQSPTWNCGTVISKHFWEIWPEGSTTFSSRETYGELRDRQVSELTDVPSFHCRSTSCSQTHVRKVFCLSDGETCGSLNLNVPDWRWAWPGPPAVHGLTRPAHSTPCATPAKRLWSNCCCSFLALLQVRPQKCCFFHLTWKHKLLLTAQSSAVRNCTQNKYLNVNKRNLIMFCRDSCSSRTPARCSLCKEEQNQNQSLKRDTPWSEKIFTHIRNFSGIYSSRLPLEICQNVPTLWRWHD